MTEDFLQYIWRTRNFDFLDMRTTAGQQVRIVDFGSMNRGSGPDFIGARISIDGTLWAGSVEMHLSSSSWHRHGHSGDPAYRNVILHVVLEDDQPVFVNGDRLPCVELWRLISPGLLSKYRKLLQLEKWIPCESVLPSVPGEIVRIFLDRMTVERIEAKAQFVRHLYRDYGGDWEQVFFVCLLRAFGFKRNAEAMEQLGRRVPVRILRLQGTDLCAMESILFGVAGMLNTLFADVYPAGLQREFKHLSRKYDLMPMEPGAWNWGRMRPHNLPSIRIAQVAQLMSSRAGLMQEILTANDLAELMKLLTTGVSDYWKSHTRFDRVVVPRSHVTGKESVHRVIMNAIVPFLFEFGNLTHKENVRERALKLAQDLPGEPNGVTRRWAVIGVDNDSAAASQGLIHLKTAYCDARRCTDCAIGHYILTSGP